MKRIEIDEVVFATTNALLCAIEGDEVWLPRSQIKGWDADCAEAGDSGTALIPDWLAQEKSIGEEL